MMHNNLIKKLIATSLIITTINIPCFATNWVTITAENGKSADLDLDSINIAIDTIEYDIRTEKNDYTYINHFSTELHKDGYPTALLYTTQYKDDVKISSEIQEHRYYKELKEGTLQAEIFDVLTKDISISKFTKGQKTWDKYLTKQRRKIMKKWKPGSFKYLNSTYINNTSFTTPVYINKITLKVDKDGNIIERNSDDKYNQLNEIQKLDPLPDGYTANSFSVGIDMKYYKYAGAKTRTKKPLVYQPSPTYATIKIAKNNRPPILGHIQLGLLKCIKFNEYLNSLSGAQLFFMFPVALASIPVTLISLILFPIFGGDSNDI